jgi:hypothetical protein
MSDKRAGAERTDKAIGRSFGTDSTTVTTTYLHQKIHIE